MKFIFKRYFAEDNFRNKEKIQSSWEILFEKLQGSRLNYRTLFQITTQRFNPRQNGFLAQTV